MEKRKIYFIIPDLFAGGAERVTITIARIMHKEGYDVEFLNLGNNEGEMKSWIEPEFKMTSLGIPRVLKAFHAVYKFMMSHPNAVYFSSIEHVSVVGLVAARLANRTMVVRIPNMPRNVLTKGVSGFKMRVIKAINQWLLKSAKVVIAQNKEMRNQLLSFYHLPEGKVVAINNPVDREYVLSNAENTLSPYNESEVAFLNVCNIAYSKGIDVLIQAWDRVKTAIPNAHMYIVGRSTSEYAEQVQRMSSSCKDFTFVGFQSNPYPYIKHCDVFVLPSRMEGFPNVVLEAMCFNRPVASTTCVDVIKDIIHPGINGFYCESENPDALAECMIKAAKLKDINNNYDMFDKQALIDCFK